MVIEVSEGYTHTCIVVLCGESFLSLYLGDDDDHHHMDDDDGDM
jgi:hypothetical protein